MRGDIFSLGFPPCTALSLHDSSACIPAAYSTCVLRRCIEPGHAILSLESGLLRGHSTVPVRTIIVVVVLVSLTALWFVDSWEYGVKFQGARYTVRMLLINLAWLAVIWSAVVSAWRRPSFTTNLLLHWLLFAWLGSCAFPNFGELP